jgi:hypothetical protein
MKTDARNKLIQCVERGNLDDVLDRMMSQTLDLTQSHIHRFTPDLKVGAYPIDMWQADREQLNIM